MTQVSAGTGRKVDSSSLPLQASNVTMRFGGRTAVNDHTAAAVPWVSESDGAVLAERLEEVGGIEA